MADIEQTLNRQQPLNCGATGCGLQRGPRIVDAGMEFVRCPTCGVLRIPPENLIHTTVLPDPAGRLSAAMKFLMSLRMHWLGRELPELRNKHVSIADIGCGDGQFLEFLAARGYDDIVGVEPDGVRAANARRRGAPVFASRGEAEAAGFLRGGVDILFVWHVLEHIERCADFIKEYTSWLAPSGVMVISVPNQASLQTRLFGYYSAYPDYGRHVWYHAADYRKWLAQNAPGFAATIMRDRNYEYEIFSWIDSIASAVVRRQNFVHKALKKGEGGPARRLAAAVAAAGLLPLAVLLAPINIRCGRPSTLTFMLRRMN
jgi:SAM-dependent methyltransferase